MWIDMWRNLWRLLVMAFALINVATAVLFDNVGASSTINAAALPAAGSGIPIWYTDANARNPILDPTFDDNQGNNTSAYLKAISANESVTGQMAAIWYLPKVTSRSGTWTITAHHATTVANFGLMNIAEITTGGGGIVVDKTNSGTITTGTPLTTSVDTTGSDANQIALAAMTVDSSTSNSGIGTGFSGGTQVMVSQDSTAHIAAAGDYKAVSSTGVINISYAITAGHTDAVVVAATFKEVGIPTLEQNRFRFRNDDGGEVGATGMAAENTNAAVKTGVNVRLRTLINASGTPGSKRILIQYRKTGTTEWKGLRGPGLARSPVVSYSTSFPANENPMSENSIWVQGGGTGLDWQDIKTTGGTACASNTSSGFNDCIAHLDSAFQQIPSDHHATGTIFKAGGYIAPDSHECELLLRWLIGPHSARGYENTLPFSGGAQMVRWNGVLNDFTILSPTGPGGGPFNNGSVVKAKIVGSTLTLYQDGTQILTVNDSTFTTGNPGVGAFVRPATGQVKESYCWADFSTSVAT
jgi:hypothetical protein